MSRRDNRNNWRSKVKSKIIISFLKLIAFFRKDSKEEREFKFLLLMRASLSGTRDFISRIKASKKTELSLDLTSQLSSVVLTKSFLKKVFGSSMSDIRSQSYQLIQDLTLSVQDTLETQLSVIGPQIFNCLAEKDPFCQPEMWKMILTLLRTCPGIWESAPIEKSMIPKISAVLRKRRTPNEDYDDSLLIFISQIPPERWNQSPVILIKVFGSAWEGLVSQNLFTAPKLLLECLIWGLLSSHQFGQEQESVFRQELIQQIMNRTVFPVLFTQTKLVLSFLSQIIKKIISVMLGRPERSPVLMEIIDCIVKQLMESVDQERTPEVIGELIEGICEDPVFQIEAKETLLEKLGLPLGRCLTNHAFALTPSPVHAVCLLQASKALNHSMIQFEDTKEKQDSIQIFNKIHEMLDESIVDSDLEVYFDLMVFCLSKTSEEIQKVQWGQLVSSMKTGLQQDEQKWNRIFTLVLRSMQKSDFDTPWKLKDLPELSKLDSNCIQLLISLRNQLLDDVQYSELLKDLLNRELEFLCPLAGALIRVDAVNGSDSDSRASWISLMVKLISVVWNLNPVSSDLRESVITAWEKGKIIECLENDVKQDLVRALETEFLDWIENDLDAELAGTVLSELLSFAPNPEDLLNRVFNEQSIKTPRTHSASPSTPLMTLCHLIKRTGPSMLDPGFDLTPMLFLELLCDPQVDPEVLNSVLDHLIESLMKGTEGLVFQLVDRCLLELQTRPEDVHFYSTALQSIFIALDHASDHLQGIQSMEKISCKLIRSLEFPLEASILEALIDILPHMVLPLRQGSLLSVVNGALEELSIPCLEDSTGMSSMFKICLLCFPIPDGKASGPLYATANEKCSLLEWIDTEEIEFWKRIAVYCVSEMEDIHGSKLRKKLVIYLRQKIHIFEEICEDLMEFATNVAQNITTAVQSPPAILHLLYKLTKNNRSVQKIVSSRIEDLMDRWSPEDVNIVELLKALSILKQIPVQIGLHQEIQECLSLTIRVVFCFGIGLHFGTLLSSELLKHILELFAGTDPAWIHLTEVLELCSGEQDLLVESIDGINVWSEVTGVDSVTCLIELISTNEVPVFLRQHCFRLLSLEPCVRALVLEDDVPELSVEDWKQQDTTQILITAKVHPSLARMLDSGELKLISWTLLLLNMESSSPSHCQRLSSILRSIPSLLDGLMQELVPLLPLSDGKRSKDYEDEILDIKKELELTVMGKQEFSLRDLVSAIGLPIKEVEWQVLAIRVYHLVLSLLPVCVRLWFNDLTSKTVSQSIRNYTVICESPYLIERQLSVIPRESTAMFGMKIKSVPVKREVIAKMEIEEGTNVELVIKLPDCLPLKPITVDWDTKVNVGNTMMRRWLFSVSAFLANHSGPLMEAIDLWKKSLQGLMHREKCLICFCVVHPTTRETPDRVCKTCKLEFHSTCLYTWFRQSSKSMCPHCQSPWTA